MSKLKDGLNKIDLSVKEFSDMSNTPIRTAYQWVDGSRRTPGIAYAYLLLWYAYKNSVPFEGLDLWLRPQLEQLKKEK